MADSIIPFYDIEGNEEYEIACMMFENCNLNCKFCFETHMNKKIDLNYFKKIPFIIEENFKKEYDRYPSLKRVYIMMWGGELFYDALSDEVFDAYYDFVATTRNIFELKFPRVEILFSWLSNGVFTKRKRVEDLVRFSKGIINFSYDPINRFSTEKQKQTMIETAKYFAHNMGSKISIVLTKDNIKEFINNDNQLVNFHKMGYIIDVNYYIANINWKDLIPTDDEIYEFLKWSVDNRLFRMKVLERIFHYYVGHYLGRYCNCKFCSQITYGEWSTDCAKCSSALPAKMFYQHNIDRITEENSNEIKASMGLMKRGCLTCKYFNRCQMPCWISFIFEGTKVGECHYKRIYEYLDQHKEIIEEFRSEYERSGPK